MFKKILAIAAIIIMIIAFAACDAPVAKINGAADITYIIGEEAPNYLSGVSAKRGDKDVTSEITVDSSKVNLQTAGTYKLTYSVDNGKKAPTIAEINVKVNNPPNAIISGVKTIIYFLGDEEPDYLDGVTATRNGLDITNEIDVNYDDVNLTTIGEYTVIYTVENAETDTREEASVKVYEKINYISTMLTEADYTGLLDQKMRAGISLRIEEIVIPLSFGAESQDDFSLLEINNLNLSIDLYSQFSQDAVELYARLNISTDMMYLLVDEARTPLFSLEGHYAAAVKNGYLYVDSLWEIKDDQNTKTDLSVALMQFLFSSDAPAEVKLVLIELAPLFAPCKEKIVFSFEEDLIDGVYEEINMLLSLIPESIYPELFEGTIFDFTATENTVTAKYEGSLADAPEEYELPEEMSILSDIIIIIAFGENKFESICASAKIDIDIAILEIAIIIDANADEIPQMGADADYELKETLTIMDVIDAINELMNPPEEPMPQ